MGVDLALWPCKHLLSFCSAWQPAPRPNTHPARNPTDSSCTPTSSTATSSTSAPTAPCTRRFVRTDWCLTGTALCTTTATTLGRRLREKGVRRHPHLLPGMPLPVWHLPGRRGLPDHFLQVCRWCSL